MMRAKKQRPQKGRGGLGFFVFGWLVIIGVFGGLIAWSIFAPFEGAVLASGRITVEDQNKAVQHLEGGIVADIFIREGDEVEANDTLIKLDDTVINAALAALDTQLYSLLSVEARLKAERDNRNSLALREDMPLSIDDQRLQDALTNQSSLLKVRLDARETQVSILDQRVAQLQSRIKGLEADILSKVQQDLLLDQEISGLRTLMDRGLATRPRLLALERTKSDLKGQSESLQAEIEATKVQIGETKLQMISVNKAYVEQVISDLSAAQAEIDSLLEERKATADRLTRLDIRAPNSGIVFGTRTHTVGGVVPPGEPIMFIVPRDDELVAAIDILPQDIDKVEVGQEARLRFSAFSQRETPEVIGVIRKIAADTRRNENTGESFYVAFVGLPSQAPLGDAFAIIPGMPVDAMLTTESRSAISYLIKPLTDSIQKTFRE